VFVVTHGLESPHTVCDRVAALANGKVIASGSMSDMLHSQHPWMHAYFQGKRAQVLARERSVMGT
jgi:phospholipid/cholesterol/gamma-HCH transport system ATP-binding protein